MSSYIENKTRVFRDAGDAPAVARKRSEGRMKAYHSATDARAWCFDNEDRRQHILDLISGDAAKGSSLGRYVPIEVLIDTLLANKNADIAKLREQVEDLQRLLDMYSSLDLTEDQKRQLEGMKREMNRAGDGLESMVTGPGSSKGASTGGAAGAAGSEGVGGAGTARTGDLTDTDEDIGESTTSKSASATPGASPSSTDGDVKHDAASTCSAATRSTCSAAAKSTVSAQEAPSEDRRETNLYGGVADEADDFQIINKDAEIISLKNALAAKEAECDQQRKIATSAIEQLENLKGIMEERDVLRKKLQDSEHELQTLKSQVASGAVSAVSSTVATTSGCDPCGLDEIAVLEKEIETLRNRGELTPQQEAEVIRKEVDVLKKYCAKLANIQQENNQLRKELEAYQAGGAPTGGDVGEAVAKLQAMTAERDKLKARVDQLEAQLATYGDLPEEVEIFRQRSKVLDDVLEERDDLQGRLNRMRGMEDQLVELKKKADRVDELERMLDGMNRNQRDSDGQLEGLKQQSKETCKDLENIIAERDMLRMKVADLATVEQEMERLRYRAKESEVLRIERDRLKVRVDELAAIECEFMQLLDKTKGLETIKCEREMYKAKYEELLGLECECDMLRAQVERAKGVEVERDAVKRQVRDCECCIADQEDEIKRLVNHIDRMTTGCNQQQDRMKQALGDMRTEIEQKNSLLVASEEQLAGVQEQLKTTITGVSCETSCLRARIEELEKIIADLRGKGGATRRASEEQLAGVQEQLKTTTTGVSCETSCLRAKIEELEKIIADLRGEGEATRRASQNLEGQVTDKDSLIERMRKELETAKSENDKMKDIADKMGGLASGDEHLEQVLKTSKCAVKKVAEELTKQYEDWDCKKGAVSKRKSADRASWTETRSVDRSSGVGQRKSVDKATGEQRSSVDRATGERRTSADRATGERRTSADKGTSDNRGDQEKADLLAQYSKEKRNSLKLSNNVQDLQDRVRQLEAELANANDMIAKLKSGVSGVERLSAENAALRRHSTEVQDVAKDQIQELVDHLKKAKDRIAELEAENERLRGVGAKGMADSASCEELRRQLASIQDEKSKLEGVIQQLQGSGGPSAADYAALEAQLQKEIKLRQGAEERVGGLNNELNGLTDKIQEKTRRSSIVETEMDAELRKSRAERDAIQNDLKNSESENASLRQQLEDLKRQLGGLQGPAAVGGVSQADLDKERAEKQALQDMLNKLQGDVAGMAKGEAAAPGLDKTTSGAAGLVAGRTASALAAQLEEEQRKAREAEEALNRLKAAMPGAASDDADAIINQGSEIAKLKERIKELENENARLRDQVMKLGGETDELRRLSKGMEDDHAAAVKRLSDDYENKLKQQGDSLKKLEESMHLSPEDQAILDQMKANYEDQIKELQDALARQKKECSDTIASLKSQMDRDIKNVHTKHNDSIVKLQGSHEEMIGDLSKDHEREVDSLRGALQSSKEALLTMEQKLKVQAGRKTSSEGTETDRKSLTMKTVENVSIRPSSKQSADTLTQPLSGKELEHFGRKGVCPCGSSFENILNKILKNGIQSLTFEELQFLHTKTCDATANMLDKRDDRSDDRSEREPPEPKVPDKLSLMRRIAALENDLMRKQKHAQHKVCALQIAVRLEKQRLDELRRTLEKEKQRNSDLAGRIGMQTKAVANLQVERDLMRRQSSYHEEKVQQFIVSVESERAKVKRLEDELDKERHNVKHLKNLLDGEKDRSKQSKRKDSSAMEVMRCQMEKAMNSEMVLKMQMDERRNPSEEGSCGCSPHQLEMVPAQQRQPRSQNASFYTELTVQDPRKKAHHSCHCKKRRSQSGRPPGSPGIDES